MPFEPCTPPLRCVYVQIKHRKRKGDRRIVRFVSFPSGNRVDGPGAAKTKRIRPARRSRSSRDWRRSAIHPELTYRRDIECETFYPTGRRSVAAAAHLQVMVWCKACGHRSEPDPAEQTRWYGPDTTVAG